MIPPLTGVRGSAPRPLLHGAQGSAPPTAGRGCKWVRRNAPAQASKKLFFEWYEGIKSKSAKSGKFTTHPAPRHSVKAPLFICTTYSIPNESFQKESPGCWLRR